MSIEYFLYSFDPRPILARELGECLKVLGWHAAVIRDQQRWTQFTVVEDGAISDFDLVVAGSEEGAKQSLEDLRSMNAENIESLFMEGVLGSCLVYSQMPYVPEEELSDAEVCAELVEVYGSEYLESRLKSKAKYGTRTSAGRSATSSQLQDVVTMAICRLRGGLFEDETSCTSQIVSIGQEPIGFSW